MGVYVGSEHCNAGSPGAADRMCGWVERMLVSSMTSNPAGYEVPVGSRAYARRPAKSKSWHLCSRVTQRVLLRAFSLLSAEAAREEE